MKYLITISLLIFLFFACATSQNTGGPKPPPAPAPPDTTTVIRYHDSTVIRYRDSMVTRILNVQGVIPLTQTVQISGNGDSTFMILDLLTRTGWISAPVGDAWPTCQNASDYCILNHIPNLNPLAGEYELSRTWVLADTAGGAYHGFTLHIRGPSNAQDGDEDVLAMMDPRFSIGPTIAIQLGKSCSVDNIGSVGMYGAPLWLSQWQILTYSWDQWSDGVTSDGRTNPECFIAIDPFSDPANYDGVLYKMYDSLKQYYFPGMSRSGSTGCTFSGLGCSQYVVGYVVTPSFQYNGELMKFENCRADWVRASYAQTQAQSKENKVLDFMNWGNSHNVFDNVHFGQWRGDGSSMPNIDGINAAGITYQGFEATTYTFHAHVANGYFEGCGRLGILQGGAGATFTNLQFDIPYGPNIPTPNPFYQGSGTTFIGGHIRKYGSGERFVMNDQGMLFIGMAFSEPPICMGNTVFQNCRNYYSNNTPYLNFNNYDSIITVREQAIVRISGSTGYMLSSSPSSYVIGDPLLTPGTNPQGDVPPFTVNQPNPYMTLGFVTSVSGDTVRFSGAGLGIPDSSVVAPVYVARYKTGFNFN